MGKITVVISNIAAGSIENKIKTIEKKFYEKESLIDIMNRTTNRAIVDIISEKYAKTFTEWKHAMDDLGFLLFGDDYGTFYCDININFAPQKIVLNLEDEKYIDMLTKDTYMVEVLKSEEA